MIVITQLSDKEMDSEMGNDLPLEVRSSELQPNLPAGRNYQSEKILPTGRRGRK